MASPESPALQVRDFAALDGFSRALPAAGFSDPPVGGAAFDLAGRAVVSQSDRDDITCIWTGGYNG